MVNVCRLLRLNSKLYSFLVFPYLVIKRVEHDLFLVLYPVHIYILFTTLCCNYCFYVSLTSLMRTFLISQILFFFANFRLTYFILVTCPVLSGEHIFGYGVGILFPLS